MNEAAYHAILRRLGVEPVGAGHAVSSGPAPTALARRTVAFRQQLAEWTASGRIVAPVFSLPGVAVTLGQCVGCGETLAEGRGWRCPVCVRAVELVLGLT
jgi:hypothetical protein